MKSRNSSQCNETLLVMSVRPGKKFGFQSAAENLQRRRRPNRIWQTVPDRCSSRWKGAVANGRTHSMWNCTHSTGHGHSNGHIQLTGRSSEFRVHQIDAPVASVPAASTSPRLHSPPAQRNQTTELLHMYTQLLKLIVHNKNTRISEQLYT